MPGAFASVTTLYPLTEGTEGEDNDEEDPDTYRWSSRERGLRPGGRRAGAWRRLDGAPAQSVPGPRARGRPVRPDDRVRRSGDGAADRRGDGRARAHRGRARRSSGGACRAVRRGGGRDPARG